MEAWKFWDWIAYASIFVAAIILAGDAALKGAPTLMLSAPNWLKSEYLSFIPLVLLLLSSAIFLIKVIRARLEFSPISQPAQSTPDKSADLQTLAALSSSSGEVRRAGFRGWWFGPIGLVGGFLLALWLVPKADDLSGKVPAAPPVPPPQAPAAAPQRQIQPSETLAMVSAMEKFFSYQKPISVVVTYPRSAQEFGNNLSVMLVTACGRLRDCHYIPSADILQEVDNGVSFSTTPGVIVHSTTTRAHVNQNLGYIFGCINPHPPRSLLVPDRIAKLNPDSNAVLYWFDIGPGEPSISNDRCGQPIYPMLD